MCKTSKIILDIWGGGNIIFLIRGKSLWRWARSLKYWKPQIIDFFGEQNILKITKVRNKKKAQMFYVISTQEMRGSEDV